MSVGVTNFQHFDRRISDHNLLLKPGTYHSHVVRSNGTCGILCSPFLPAFENIKNSVFHFGINTY